MSDTPHEADAAVTTPGPRGTDALPYDATNATDAAVTTPGPRGADALPRDATNATDAAVPSPSDDDDGADLARITTDFDGVEEALRRLDDGTYWTDEVTGEPITDEILATDPIARRGR